MAIKCTISIDFPKKYNILLLKTILDFFRRYQNEHTLIRNCSLTIPKITITNIRNKL